MKASEEVTQFIDDLKLRDVSMRMINQFRDGKVGREWFKFTDYPTIKLYYKKEKNRNLYTFYCEKLVEAPLFNLVSIIAEAQTYKNWVPLLYRSDIPYEPSHFRKSASFAVRVPWPWSNRSA